VSQGSLECGKGFVRKQIGEQRRWAGKAAAFNLAELLAESASSRIVPRARTIVATPLSLAEALGHGRTHSRKLRFAEQISACLPERETRFDRARAATIPPTIIRTISAIAWFVRTSSARRPPLLRVPAYLGRRAWLHVAAGRMVPPRSRPAVVDTGQRSRPDFAMASGGRIRRLPLTHGRR
jgi:hypothetical protein